MIRILRGPGPARAFRCSQLRADLARQGRRPVVLTPARTDRALPARSWDGLRRLLAARAKWDRAPAVDAVLARHLPVASLLLPRLADRLDAEGERQRRLMAARETSHLSHNLLIQRPFFEAVAHLLADLLPGTTLLLPELDGLDRETLAALRTLARRRPADLPDLVVGLGDPLPRTAPDEDGIRWHTPPEDLLDLVLGFQTLAGTVTEELTAGDGEPPAPAEASRDEAPVDPHWEDVDELAARRALLTVLRPPALEGDAAAAAVGALASTFRRYSFTSALRLGRALLRSGTPLDAPTRARVHGLVALAAHNRQFRTLGNRALAETLERHLLEAWTGETEPARRSALAYRLAVTTGRRMKDVDACLEWSDKAVDEARSGDLDADTTAHLEAWGRNIRAYALTRAERPGEAVRECETAFRLLQERMEAASLSPEEAAEAGDPLLREIAATHALLADNLAALAEIRGDADTFLTWKERAESPMAGFSGLLRFEGTTWIRLHRQAHRLDRALPRALEALEAARGEQDAPRLYRYMVEAADLADRLGRSEEALEHFRHARQLRSRMGEPDFLRPLAPAHAGAALRADRPGQARELLLEALENGLDPPAEAELRATLALATAMAGDLQAAEAEANRAIETAVAAGSRDTLLRVAVTVGEISRQAGRREEAREAFQRGLEIADSGDTPPPAADLLAARLGCHETGGPPPGGLGATLALLDEALDDAATWALLPRLAKLAEAADGDADSADDHALLRRVLAQRHARYNPRHE